MKFTRTMDKRARLITWMGYGAWIIVLLMALVMYHERLALDSGYYVARTINEHNFHVEHNRFVLILAELVPFIFSTLQLPLSVVLIGYSLNHVLFPIWITAIIYNETKQPLWWLMMSVTSLFQLSLGWFVPQFEMYYGGWLLLLAFVLLQKNKWTFFRVVTLFVILFYALTAHFFVMVMMFFVVLNYLKKDNQQSWWGALVIVLFAAFILYYKSMLVGAYEDEYMQIFSKHFKEFYWLHISYWFRFSWFLIQHYGFYLLVVLWLLWQWYRTKNRWVLITWATNFFIVLWFIAVILGDASASRYQQQVFFSLLLLFYIGTAYLLMRPPRSLRLNKEVGLVFASIFVVSSINIFRNYYQLKTRTQLIQNLVHLADSASMCKVTYPDSVFHLQQNSAFDAEWSLPIESLLISAEHGRQHTVSLLSTNSFMFDNNYLRNYKTHFLFRFNQYWPLRYLNHHYFQLDSSNYRPLTTNLKSIRQ